MILGENIDHPGFLLALTPLEEDAMADGFMAEITIGVVPGATPEPAGFGGGPQGPRPDAPPPGEAPPPA